MSDFIPCLSCRAGLHNECDNTTPLDEVFSSCCCWSAEAQSSEADTQTIVIGGYKENEEVLDPTSTGRKRAAKLKPIILGMTCEWAGLLNAGGGVKPIVGCEGIKLTPEKGHKENTGNVHHGPDKSTLTNVDENLHRVCGKCHNRWHYLNDPYYGQRPADGSPYLPLEVEALPHDKRTVADEATFKRSEAWWKMDDNLRPEYLKFVKEGEYVGRT